MARKKATPKKTGRPLTKIDYKALQNMCNIQCTGEEIAAIFGINYDTLNRRIKEDGHVSFTEYFKKHSAGGKMSLRRVQMKKAIQDENVTMLIWLGKQVLGQRDSIENEQGEGTFDIELTVREKVE